MTGNTGLALCNASSSLVRTEIVDAVALLTLDDAGHRNTVTVRLSLDLEAACAALHVSNEVNAVVLTAGPAFSAGGDLASLSDGSVPLSDLYRGFEALAKLPMPTIAAVNGPAVGAGINFALSCDVIMAAESARFDPRFLDIGIHPGGGHLWRTIGRIGRQATAALVLFGESLTGQQAAELGLAWRCTPDEELLAVSRALAARAARRSPELVRRTKATLNASVPLTNLRDAVDLEAVAQRWSMSRPAFREGVAALRERLSRI